MAGPLALSTEQDVACIDLIGHTARPAQPANDCKSNIYLDRLVVGGKGILRGAGWGNGSTVNRSILVRISLMTSNYGAGKSKTTLADVSSLSQPSVYICFASCHGKTWDDRQ